MPDVDNETEETTPEETPEVKPPRGCGRYHPGECTSEWPYGNREW